MTAKRGADFSLEQALRDPGFTPRVRDVPALLSLLEAPDSADLAERALARAGAAGARAVVERFDRSPARVQKRLARALGTMAATTGAPELRAFLVERLADLDAGVRGAAATAVGKLDAGEDVASALSRALGAETDAAAQRALVAALGKVGGERALEALAAVTGGGSDLDRVRSRARLIATRTETRTEPSAIALDRPAPTPTPVSLRCRAGLEHILLDELAVREAHLSDARLARDRFGAAGRVLATLAGAPRDLLVARTALSFGFPLRPRPQDGDLADTLALALTSDEALAIFERWTVGAVRYRIAWAGGGKRRSVVWAAAEAVSRRRPELVNDPTQSTWEAVVHEADGWVLVELTPRFDDPRFAYRTRDVPAASHPTIAAALARLAGDDREAVVWDPFVGSGTELCERALRGPYRRLIGSDRDPRALEAARTNLRAAGARGAVLVRADAASYVPPERPTVIVTNPPLGRRVARGADLAGELDRFVDHAARLLAPGGRFVWIAPFGRRSRSLAQRSGLRLELANDVDMGGFAAELQVFTKPR